MIPFPLFPSPAGSMKFLQWHIIVLWEPRGKTKVWRTPVTGSSWGFSYRLIHTLPIHQLDFRIFCPTTGSCRGFWSWIFCFGKLGFSVYSLSLNVQGAVWPMISFLWMSDELLTFQCVLLTCSWDGVATSNFLICGTRVEDCHWLIS